MQQLWRPKADDLLHEQYTVVASSTSLHGATERVLIRPVSVTSVGDFLLHLFFSGLQFRNYRSAIVAEHGGFSNGFSISDNVAIKQSLKGKFVERPLTRCLLPSWDLPSILQGLMEPPFEPISDGLLPLLPIKLAFLLAVTASQQRSEVRALSWWRVTLGGSLMLFVSSLS